MAEPDPVQQERDRIAAWLRGMMPHWSTLRPINNSMEALANHQQISAMAATYHHLAWQVETGNYAPSPT